MNYIQTLGTVFLFCATLIALIVVFSNPITINSIEWYGCLTFAIFGITTLVWILK